MELKACLCKSSDFIQAPAWQFSICNSFHWGLQSCWVQNSCKGLFPKMSDSLSISVAKVMLKMIHCSAVTFSQAGLLSHWQLPEVVKISGYPSFLFLGNTLGQQHCNGPWPLGSDIVMSRHVVTSRYAMTSLLCSPWGGDHSSSFLIWLELSEIPSGGLHEHIINGCQLLTHYPDCVGTLGLPHTLHTYWHGFPRCPLGA